jgi:hypothetical protein
LRGRLFRIDQGSLLIMKRILLAVVVLSLALHALGCGGDTDKGINKDKDRPETPKKKP